MTVDEFVRGAGADDLIDKACQDVANDIRNKTNAADVKPASWHYIIKENNKQTDDPVNHPSHYCSGDIECIDA